MVLGAIKQGSCVVAIKCKRTALVCAAAIEDQYVHGGTRSNFPQYVFNHRNHYIREGFQLEFVYGKTFAR